jgi:PAS domain S-box-containing protein
MRIAQTQRLQKVVRCAKEVKRRTYVRALEKDHDDLELQNQSLLQAQLELETSRDHYAELFDNAPVCFITLTQTGVIREINLPGARLLSPRQLLLRGAPFITFVAQEESRNFLTHLRLCRNNSDPTRAISVELQLARKPGEKPVFIELVSLPSMENERGRAVFKSVFRDITEIKEMQEVHRWLAAIVESSVDAIIGKDLDGKIISCNRGAERLFGYTPEELVGKPTTLLVPPELLNEELQFLERLRGGEKIEHYETTRQRKNGTLVPVSLTLSPIFDARGKIIGSSNIAHDISQRKVSERKLEESLTREKAANRAKDDFLAALSHELRTPLNPALLLASDGARNPDFSPQARMDLDSIRKNIELEGRLIDDMLDLTRITHGKLTLEKKPVDIHAALQDAVETVRADIIRKKIELVLNLNAGEPVVLGDAVRLRQIFWNILKNAVKFTPEDGKISMETRTSPGNKIIITITDTGMGMEPGEIERIFGAFAQGTHQFGGLGLGLAISRALVELHSGSICAESPGKGKGATFTIELPLTRKIKNPEPAVKPARTPATRISGQGISILLVEDHEPTRISLMHLLVRRNYKVVPAGSLSEARSLLEKEKFNLLISDIGLPDGNGCDLMEESHKRLHLKGIALTGYGMEHDITRSREAGFIAHLTKPVHIESLDNALIAATKSLR